MDSRLKVQSNYSKHLWHIFIHKHVTKDLKVLFETNCKTEAFEKYENRRLNLECLGIDQSSNDPNLKCNSGEDVIFFKSSDFTLDFDPAVFVKGNIRFNPPVFQQRYLTIAHIINNEKWRGKIKKVVEFGCAEIGLLNYLKLIQGISEINLVDIDGQLLKDNVHRIQPWFCESYNFQRAVPLTVNVLRGSVSHPDRYCKKVDAVIAIELIEHMFEDELAQLPQNIFGYIRPRVAIFTTPNSDFNVLFINFSGSRHPDHKFEWSRKEFEAWANHICVSYPDYKVNFIGIGPPPTGKEHLGYCSQGAVFLRSHNVADDDNNQNQCEELNAISYELIETAEFPVEEQIDPKIKTLNEAGQYIRTCDRLGEFQKDYRTVIPLSSILIRVYKTCKSTQKLREILEEKYTIEENSDGEEVLIYTGESDSESDSELDENDLTNVVQERNDFTEDNFQWEQGSCSSWGSVKGTEKNVVDVDPWGEQSSCVTWNCETTESEPVKNCEATESEPAKKAPTASVSSVNSASDASCVNLDELKEILTNLPSLQPYCEPDYTYDPAEDVLVDDDRSYGLETIVSVSDENYESSNGSSNCQIRSSNSSAVMDLDDRKSLMSFAVESGHLSENRLKHSQYANGDELTKTKSLHSIGERHPADKCGAELTATKSSHSIGDNYEHACESYGDNLKNWRSLQSLNEKPKVLSRKSSQMLTTVDNEMKNAKTVSFEQDNLSNKCEEIRGGFVSEVESSQGSQNNDCTVSPEFQKVGVPVDEVNIAENLQSNSFERTNISDVECSVIGIEDSTSFQSVPVTVDTEYTDTEDTQESCGRDEKKLSDFDEEMLSDFDSMCSLSPHEQQRRDKTVNSLDVALEADDKISVNVDSKLPESVGNTSDLPCHSENLAACDTGMCELGSFKIISAFKTDENKVSCKNRQQFESDDSCEAQFEEMDSNSLERFNNLRETSSNDCLGKFDEKQEPVEVDCKKCDSLVSNLTYVCDSDVDGEVTVSKLPITHGGCDDKKVENVSGIEINDSLSSRQSQSKDSDLSYKSCDTSIREEDDTFRSNFVGNTCLPELVGLNLAQASNKQSSSSTSLASNADESRRFSSTSFIFKSQSQEKIKEIYSFKSLASNRFESDGKNNCKVGVPDVKDCDSPLHKCHSTGKIGKDFSAYNDGVISNSCVDKFPSSLASEFEFYDKNNDLARERRCMSVSCIGNINMEYDENSSMDMEEREMQNSCSPDKFGPDSGYPNSSSGLDMEMDTPEQVKEIMTESESSFDESPLESPVGDEQPLGNLPVNHPPVIPVGDNVENGDVANNNRDGEGNNMVGPGIVGDILEFNALIEENAGNLPLMEAACNLEGLNPCCVEDSKVAATAEVGNCDESQIKDGIQPVSSSVSNLEQSTQSLPSSNSCTPALDQPPLETNNNCDGQTLKALDIVGDEIDSSVGKKENCRENQETDGIQQLSCCVSNVEQNPLPSSSTIPHSDQLPLESNNNCDEQILKVVDKMESGVGMEINSVENQQLSCPAFNLEQNPQSLPSRCSPPLESNNNCDDKILKVPNDVDYEMESGVGMEINSVENQQLSCPVSNLEQSSQSLPSSCSPPLDQLPLETSNNCDDRILKESDIVDDKVESSVGEDVNSVENQETDGIQPVPSPVYNLDQSSAQNDSPLSTSYTPSQDHLPPPPQSETEDNSDELNIDAVNDLSSLVPLTLVEIVLNRLVREMAEDVLMQVEIGQALFFAADAMFDVEVSIEQDPTDFMGGGDSAPDNM